MTSAQILPIAVASGSQALPLIAGLRRWNLQTPARRVIMLWCFLLLAGDVVSLSIGLSGRENLWLNYWMEPIEAVALFWALSLFQTSPLARQTIRLLIPLFLVAFVLVVWAVEDRTSFSRVAEPMRAVLLLGTAVFTLHYRSTHTTRPLLEQDWFWICASLAVIYASGAMLPPLAAALVRTRPDIVRAAYYVRAVLFVCAILGITRGMMCPRTA